MNIVLFDNAVNDFGCITSKIWLIWKKFVNTFNWRTMAMPWDVLCLDPALGMVVLISVLHLLNKCIYWLKFRHYMLKCWILLKPVLGGADGNVYVPVPSLKRLNHTVHPFHLFLFWSFKGFCFYLDTLVHLRKLLNS
jgi:hypothetical protein